MFNNASMDEVIKFLKFHRVSLNAGTVHSFEIIKYGHAIDRLEELVKEENKAEVLQ